MIFKLIILILIVLVSVSTAAPEWVPADVAARLSAVPNSTKDDSVKNIIIPDYEMRIAVLDSNNAIVKQNLRSLYDNVIALYSQYNRNWTWAPTGYSAILEDTEFYLTHLEAGNNPEVEIRGRFMRKGYFSRGGLSSYVIWVPRNYSHDRAWPLTTAIQIGPPWNVVFKEIITNTNYIAISCIEDAAIRDLATDLHIDPYRTYCTGFSQGGHITMTNGWRFPHQFAAIIPNCPDLRLPNQASYFYNCRYLKNVPTRIIAGIFDGYTDGTELVYDAMRGFDCPVEYMPVDAGHHPSPFLDPDMFNMISTFFDKYVLNPYPTEVYHVVESGKKTYSRAFWVDGKCAQNFAGDGRPGFNPVYHVSIDTSTNTISIDSSDVYISAFDFYLDSNFVDMDSPVTVVRNGTTLYDGQIPVDGVVSVVVSQTYNIPPTATSKGSTILAAHASSGVKKLQWQVLDSIRCERFGSCGMPIPIAIEDGETNITSVAMQKDVLSVSPNPFNPSTSIHLKLQNADFKFINLKIEIFNANGELIKELTSSIKNLKSKIYNLKWNAANHPSGIYIVHATIDGKVLAKRITLIR